MNALRLGGQVDGLLDRLREFLSSIAKRGPNRKTKRETLEAQIRYFGERREIMRYDEYRREDLVLATGVIEGACRYVMGERLDCSGMRWILKGAQAVLQLRCIELNGDWDAFIRWAESEYTEELKKRKLVQVREKKTQTKLTGKGRINVD